MLNIHFFVYGSTNLSAGYSVLACSKNITTEEQKELVQICDNLDAQAHAVPKFNYSVETRKWQDQLLWIETFGGWHDQVGRPSRVIRISLLSFSTWQKIGYNPFVLKSMLPKIRACLNIKRGEVRELEDLDLASYDQTHWNKLWSREMKFFLRHWKRLTPKEQDLVLSLQRENDTTVVNLYTAQPENDLLRLVLFSLPVEVREKRTFASFQINQQTTESGVLFYYQKYQEGNASYSTKSCEIGEKLTWQLETITKSVPEHFRFQVLSQLWRSQQRKIHSLWGTVVLVFILLLVFKIIP